MFEDDDVEAADRIVDCRRLVGRALRCPLDRSSAFIFSQDGSAEAVRKRTSLIISGKARGLARRGDREKKRKARRRKVALDTMLVLPFHNFLGLRYN